MLPAEEFPPFLGGLGRAAVVLSKMAQSECDGSLFPVPGRRSGDSSITVRFLQGVAMACVVKLETARPIFADRQRSLLWSSLLALFIGSLFATRAMAIDVASQTDWNTAVAAVSAAGAKRLMRARKACYKSSRSPLKNGCAPCPRPISPGIRSQPSIRVRPK